MSFGSAALKWVIHPVVVVPIIIVASVVAGVVAIRYLLVGDPSRPRLSHSQTVVVFERCMDVRATLRAEVRENIIVDDVDYCRQLRHATAPKHSHPSSRQPGAP